MPANPGPGDPVVFLSHSPGRVSNRQATARIALINTDREKPAVVHVGRCPVLLETREKRTMFETHH